MTIGSTGFPAVSERQLFMLLQDVLDARRALAEDRRAPTGPKGSSGAARGDLLCALDAYTAALASRHLPVPYALRDELRIQRRSQR